MWFDDSLVGDLAARTCGMHLMWWLFSLLSPSSIVGANSTSSLGVTTLERQHWCPQCLCPSPRATTLTWQRWSFQSRCRSRWCWIGRSSTAHASPWPRWECRHSWGSLQGHKANDPFDKRAWYCVASEVSLFFISSLYTMCSCTAM